MAIEGLRNLDKATIVKIGKRSHEIGSRVWIDHIPVRNIAIAETSSHLSPKEAAKLSYRAAKPGRQWGKPWETAWFRLRFTVPSSFRGETVSLLFKTGGEAIIFRDGNPVQALDSGRHDYMLLNTAAGGERIELFVESGANAAFGAFDRRTMETPRIAVFLQDVWDAWMDVRSLYEMVRPTPPDELINNAMRGMDEDDTRRAGIVYALNKAVDVFDYRDTSRSGLNASARRVRRALKDVYALASGGATQTAACMGHAHIDVAWLWPLSETVRKCGRTFSNVLELMERYPDFTFCQSQPALYEFTRDRYPGIYRNIKKKVRKGQWIPTGCMWVEADCNVTSGESLVRQILFGSRFFKREFGHEEICLWLPDVFGYSAALPQLLKRSGIDYFLTTKISWNQFTTFPHHTFYWEGLDGSTVLTHFPPGNSYNSRLEAHQLLAAARRYRQKDRSPMHAAVFGYGDGGGGPTADMIERMRRYRNLDGTPRLEPMSPREFFSRLDRESADLPRWVGELYLELHRATYTTQAENKRSNRRCELLLRETEILASLNLAAGHKYPQNDLNRAWKTVLLNQFHDIIPGSSIDLVYEESRRQYSAVLESVESTKQRALDRYSRRVDTTGSGLPVLAFNPLSWDRRNEIVLRSSRLRKNRCYVAVSPDGAETPVQIGVDGATRFIGNVPSLGHAVFHIREGRTGAPVVRATKRLLENARLRVRLDARGRITSIFDKISRREAIQAGSGGGNRFILFEDKPNQWDAWDVDIFYADKVLEKDGTLMSVDVLEEGQVRSVIRIKRRISNSTIEQDVILASDASQVDFVTSVDWGDERDVLLKVAFPVSVRSMHARYEIQFGNVERPTHWNTPGDFARFEVPAQRWADLSEGDYGVALLNDSKYGHDIRDNVMRLTLLRAPKVPDPTADVNRTHKFTYSIYPHAGNYAQARVVQAGYELNAPVTACPTKASRGEIGAEESLFGVTGCNVVIDTIKKAEDDSGLIVRLYEATGSRCRRTISTSLPLKHAVETDLMEREERKLNMRGGKIALDFKPFQIRTIKYR